MEKILIIEDDKMNLELAIMTLEDAGFTVISAENGEKGLTLIEKENPDLILLDIFLPGENGFDICKKIKSNPKTKEIPVIFVTALEEISAKKEGFEIGADDYITKPYITEELLLRVELILRFKREKDNLKAMAVDIAGNEKNLTENQTKIIEKEKELLLKQIYVSLHHEIRNPLTTILLGSQLLKSMFADKPAEKKVVNEVINCARRIRTIMDSLSKMKNIVIDEYVNGVPMVDFKKSS